MKKLSLIMIVTLTTSGLTWGKAPAKTPALLEKGKAAYATNCASCHGDKGDGDTPISKALTPPPRDFIKSKFKKGDKIEQIFATISNGSDGTAMVAFKHLSEEDRWAIAYHVKAFKK